MSESADGRDAAPADATTAAPGCSDSGISNLRVRSAPESAQTAAAPMSTWLTGPLEPKVAATLERMRRAADVRHVAVMPDVHLAVDVCVGTVLATDRLVYPQAVGGDIGCGMLAVAFDAGADALADPGVAARVLSRLYGAVPSSRRHRARTAAPPPDLAAEPLSHGSLEAVRRSEGALQLGTLGGGNHFVELQADDGDGGRLWLMIHSGSRAMGQAIKDHHLARAQPVGGGLKALDAATDAGRAYAVDVQWARRYADANRQAMAEAVAEVLRKELGVRRADEPAVACDHNHLAREDHFGTPLWVHRKGAAPADAGQAGVIPGSMGTLSYHVEGRGRPEALRSSAHGAGRAMSREKARQSLTPHQLIRQMAGVWFDYRRARDLREESPTAYKDVRAVMRAQQELVRVVRTLRPLLVYKAR